MDIEYDIVCPDCKEGWDDADHMGCEVIDYSKGWAKDLADSYLKMSEKMMANPQLYGLDYHGTHEGYHICKKRDEGACQPCTDAMQAYGKKYRSKPGVKERKAKWNRTRRSRSRHSTSTKITVQQVVSMYGNTCHLCNTAIDLNAPRKTGEQNWESGLHIDHVIPISKGGSDTIENVRPSHGKCNIRKHNKIG